MFEKIIEVIQRLLTLGLLLGFIFSYAKKAYEKIGYRIVKYMILAGAVAAAVMAFMKNATNKIDTSWWNLRIFIAVILVMILTLVFNPLRKKMGKTGSILASVFLGAEAFLQVFYTAPDSIAYPYSIYVAEGLGSADTSIFASDYFVKLGGVLLALALILLAASALYRGCMRLESGKVYTLMMIAIGITVVKEIGAMVNIMMTKRIISNNHMLFVFAKYCNNYSNLFIYATMIVACVTAVILWIRSMHVNEPYSNPAQHRKIRAKWRSIRRWSSALVVCCVIGVLSLTVVNNIVNKEVELSPTVTATVEDGYVKVPLDEVSDGHIHRYGYTTEDNITVRFIVIQKPGSTSYGIGLDACDICGKTGYYEKDGQVVCNRCDVVMNINTIGFKGGCNPIVIEYKISDGYIWVTTDELTSHQDEFK